MENSKFFEERVAHLAPPDGWEPDTAVALRLHYARRREESRRAPAFWWKLAIAASLLVALALAPSTRALAQRLWKLLVLNRMEVVRIDLGGLPNDSSLRAQMLQPPGKMIKVDDAESARAQVGFLPRLPQPGVLSGTPRLSVLGRVAFGITLKADDLRQLLRSARVDEMVPAQWDGARIVVETAGTVMAEWPENDTMLIQTPPLAMAVPQDFDLRAFTTLVFRGLKLPRDEAERLGARMAAEPAWMLPIDPQEKVGIREVVLHGGLGTLVYDYGEDNPNRIERLTLMWSASDRVYILSTGMGDAKAIATANAIE